MEIPQSRCFNGKNNDKIDGYTYLYISIDMKIYKMDMYQYIYNHIYIVIYGERERDIYIYIISHMGKDFFKQTKLVRTFIFWAFLLNFEDPICPKCAIW